MDNKKFASQVTLLILVNLLVKLVWIFFIERKVQITVGFENFGLYYSIFSLTLILGIINDPGLNNYLIQYLSINKTATQHISELFYIKTFLAGLYVFASILISLLLGFDNYYLLALLIVYQVLYSFLTYFRGFLKANQLLKSEIFFSVLDKTLFIIAFLPLLYFDSNFNWTINFYVIAQIVALTLALILCIYHLYHQKIFIFGSAEIALKLSENTNQTKTTNTRQRNNLLNWKTTKLTLKKIIPFAVFAFLVLAYNKIDTVMLSKMSPNGAIQTGIYVAAYRFLDAASMLPVLFATLFYPVICKIISDKIKLNEIINNSISLLIPITLIIAMASWFYRNNLMQFLYAQDNSEQLSLIFGILMFSLPLIVVYYIFSTFFTASNHLKLLNLVSAGGLTINVVLNILLIPIYQALGAAISSVASFFIVGFAYLILFYIKFKYPFQALIWIKVLSLLLLLIILGYLMSYALQNWMLGFVLYILLATIITGILKFFDVKNLRDIIRLKA